MTRECESILRLVIQCTDSHFQCTDMSESVFFFSFKPILRVWKISEKM